VLPVLRYLRCGAVCRVSSRVCQANEKAPCWETWVLLLLLCLPYGPVHIASRLTVPPRKMKRTARLRLQPRYIALHYLHLRSHYLSLTAAALHLSTQHLPLHQPPGLPTQSDLGGPKEKGAVSVVCPPSSCSSSFVVPAFSRPLPCRAAPYPTLPYHTHLGIAGCGQARDTLCV
jgi:hypothetical protein